MEVGGDVAKILTISGEILSCMGSKESNKWIGNGGQKGYSTV
jgi:hypothetical protein